MSALRLAIVPLALLLVASLARAQVPAALPPETEVELESERLVWLEDGTVRAEGTVRLRAGTIRIAAEQVRYDSAAGVAEVEGGFTLLDGTFVARGERGLLRLRTGEAELHEVSLWEKREPPAPEEVFGADATALRLLGRNALDLRASSVERLADGTWVARRPTVTTCDCDEDPPSWTMGAASVRYAGERVRLVWPVFYVRGVPVAALPYFSVPLSGADREPGLLAPEINLFGRRGFSWEQPLFVPLGDSYDATFTAGYFFGSEVEREVADPSAPGGTREMEVDRAFEGPRLGLELRWAPRVGSEGRAFGAWAWDHSYRPPSRGSRLPGTVPTGAPVRFPVDGPHRFMVQLDQVDDWSGGFSDRISLDLVSDRFYLRDFTDEVVLRSNGVLASSAWFANRQGPLLLALEGTYLQDLRLPFPGGAPVPADLPPETSRLFGSERRNTFSRLPALSVDLARLSLPFGAGLDLHLGAARFAPVGGRTTGDEGSDGIGPGDPIYPGPDPDGTEGNGRYDPGERQAVARLALRPTLSLPVVAGRWLSLTPWAGWRQLFYQNEESGDGHAGWGVLGLDAHTELARTFAGGEVRHAWIPRLELRHLIPGDASEAPLLPYDELDVRPLARFTQGRVSLGSRIDVATTTGDLLALEAEVGQDVRIDPEAELAESWLRARIDRMPFRLDGILRWDPHGGELDEVSTSASLTAKAGHQLRLGYRQVGEGGSLGLLAGPDQLFAPGAGLATDLVPPGILPHVEQVSAGVTVVPSAGLSLRYDLIWLPTLERDPLLEQRAALGYTSPCGCWGTELRLALRRGEALSLGFSLDLGGLLRI